MIINFKLFEKAKFTVEKLAKLAKALEDIYLWQKEHQENAREFMKFIHPLLIKENPTIAHIVKSHKATKRTGII
jgi:ABC-type nitrate/sulfonate/bicarbonate transport system substrate-binding protein